jgi:hypothetical protein
MTGVAVSPLLGVSGLGAWTFFRTPVELRSRLPWYCHPIAWGVGLSIIALCAFKDLFGSAVPPVLKKPFDLVELFQDKLSALVASAAFLPILAEQMSEHFGHGSVFPVTASALQTGSCIAGISPLVAYFSISLAWFLIPLGFVAFFAVWLSGHAANILLILSPFSFLDLLIKLTRYVFMGFLVVLYLISPVLAAVLCGIIIALALYLMPRTLRLSVFSTVMILDYVKSLLRITAAGNKIRAFTARRLKNDLPARTAGSLMLDESGRIVFVCRRFCFGPRRTICLSDHPQLVIEKSLLFPTILRQKSEDERPRVVFYLLPRYRHQIVPVSQILGIHTILENKIVRGFKAATQWVLATVRNDQPALEYAPAAEGMQTSGESDRTELT